LVMTCLKATGYTGNKAESSWNTYPGSKCTPNIRLTAIRSSIQRYQEVFIRYHASGPISLCTCRRKQRRGKLEKHISKIQKRSCAAAAYFIFFVAR
jgi:hypothetical protein